MFLLLNLENGSFYDSGLFGRLLNTYLQGRLCLQQFPELMFVVQFHSSPVEIRVGGNGYVQ